MSEDYSFFLVSIAYLSQIGLSYKGKGKGQGCTTASKSITGPLWFSGSKQILAIAD